MSHVGRICSAASNVPDVTLDSSYFRAAAYSLGCDDPAGIGSDSGRSTS